MTNKYPIGIQNFESLRNDGYVYADKTALMCKLASSGRYCFLDRPRLLDKSLPSMTVENKQPLISVIVPVYNAKECVAEQRTYSKNNL